MKRILGWVMAAGLCLGISNMAQAAPVSAGSARMTDLAAEGSRAMVNEVGYHRRHYGRGHYGRRVYHRRHYARPVHYRPVRYRPVYAAPVYYGGYGYGPRCYIKIRKVYTWQGLVRKRVRICNY
ncbi:MAG: hypothetical protein ACRCUE_01105 [Bosea sp. (in: a-proteobacteria)]